jgi:hypothetical protein
MAREEIERTESFNETIDKWYEEILPKLEKAG